MGRTIYKVGTIVSKSFFDDEIQQERPYIGKVVSYNPKRKLYKIKYDEDDDSEELSDSEMDDVVNEQKKKRSSIVDQYRPTHFQAKYGTPLSKSTYSKTHVTSSHSFKDSYKGMIFQRVNLLYIMKMEKNDITTHSIPSTDVQYMAIIIIIPNQSSYNHLTLKNQWMMI